MTPKERAAMQQALKVMRGINHGTDWNNGTHAAIYRPMFPGAITELEEALAQPEFTAEQKDRFATAFDEAFAKAGLPQQPASRQSLSNDGNSEPVGKHICNLWIDPVTKYYVVDHCDHPTDELIPAYTAPQLVSIPSESETDSSSSTMRTTLKEVELTDDEIAEALRLDELPDVVRPVFIQNARAVIAAYKEKNK